MPRWGSCLVLLALSTGSALAQTAAELRAGFIECGTAQIRALAQCYGKSDYCASETLSFSRRAGRTIVPVHAHSARFEVPGGKAQALAYAATSWACVPGANSGHYLVVVMSRANGAACSECEYSRLYDLYGRLIATDLGFSARGEPRASASGPEMMRKLLGGAGPHPFTSVYPKSGSVPH